jgi:hypothetical protein
MEARYIVMRQVAPTNQGVILHYVTTTKPVAGELIYTGEFISRIETWGLNEPVRAEILEPMGDVTSESFDAAATQFSDDKVIIHAYQSEAARNWMNRRFRESANTQP